MKRDQYLRVFILDPLTASTEDMLMLKIVEKKTLLYIDPDGE